MVFVLSATYFTGAIDRYSAWKAAGYPEPDTLILAAEPIFLTLGWLLTGIAVICLSSAKVIFKALKRKEK
jgi:hypothetical protein